MIGCDNDTVTVHGTPASSSDEDEQRAELLLQRARNEQLFVAARRKRPQAQIIQEIQELLNDGADINALNSRGKTILDIACQKNYDSLVKFISIRGGATAYNLTKSCTYARPDSQEYVQSTASNAVFGHNKQEIDALLLVDGKKYLTDFKLDRLNQKLRFGLDTQVVINSLRECGIDIHYEDPNTKQLAIDLSWDSKYYETMLMLLEADSYFPKDFTTDGLDEDNIPEKLKNFVRERQELHHWIKNNRLVDIKKYIVNHQSSKYFNSDNKSALETAAEHANVETLAVLIDVQLPLNEINISDHHRNLLYQVNTEGNTLLSIAAQSGKVDIVDFLIRCGCHIEYRNKSQKIAIDLAWDYEHYDVVLLLLKADSQFPYNFNLDKLNQKNDKNKTLRAFVQERNDLHTSIKENCLTNEKIIASETSKLYLNYDGQSALFTSIKSKRLEIFASLKSKGLTFKNEDEEKYLGTLTIGERDTLKTAMIRKFPQVERGHILYLISKSRSPKHVQNFKDRIENLFRYLDGISEVSIIMQVLQYTDYVDIVFDFDNENILEINPTASETTRGTTDYKDGRIYIAAKAEEKQLAGTLAHELTHLAMYVLYKNDCNPFDNSDNSQSRLFFKITGMIKENTKTIVKILKNAKDSPLITLVRAFQYPDNEQQSELIVRVPHILAQYPETGRSFLVTHDKFKLLYDFYNNLHEGGLLYRCKEFTDNSFLIKPKNSIQFINETYGEINGILKYGVQFEKATNIEHFLESRKQVLVVVTESKILSILSIYESLTYIKNHSLQDSLYVDLFTYAEKEDEIVKSFYSPAGKLLCLSDFRDSNKINLSSILTKLKMLLEHKSHKKIIFILQQTDINSLTKITAVFQTIYEQIITHKFTLNDFTNRSQQKLLERKIILNEQDIYLKDLISVLESNEKRVLDTKTIVKLMKKDKILIGCRQPDTSDLEGAYSELFEEVDMKAFMFNLQELKESCIITGLPGPDKRTSLINYLSSEIDNISKKVKVQNLIDHITVFNSGTKISIKKEMIFVADDQFKEETFKYICRNNSSVKINWINVKIEVNPWKFILQKIYNPKFYIAEKRFNREVVIEKKIVEEFCSATLCDLFIICLDHTSEIKKWFPFQDKQNTQFAMNCNNNIIQFVTPSDQDDEEIVFAKRVTSNADKAIHLLHYKKNLFIWRKSYGSLHNLTKYRAKDHQIIQPLIAEDNVIEEIRTKKALIITGDPGTGKSTAVTYFCNKEHFVMRSHWVIRINLKEHLEAIKNITVCYFNLDEAGIISEITDFLLHAVKGTCDIESVSLTKRLLGIRLRKDCRKPLFIVFDGYNEVLDEANRNKIILLLQYIKNKTHAKFCVTSRLHYEKELENALSTFAIRLEPLNESAIRTFITKSLRNHLSLLLTPKKIVEVFDNNGIELMKYIDEFFTKMQEVFKGDVFKFIGIPLQLNLMLEGSAGCFKKLIKDNFALKPDFSYLGNDIWEVYTHFVDRKYYIYCKKMGIIEEKQQQEGREHFDKYHNGLAKYVISMKPEINRSVKKFKSIVLSAGIIRSDGKSLDFVHPTFAEYFAANGFMYWIRKWKEDNHSELSNLSKYKYFFNCILLKSDYRVIRTFLNAKLLKMRIKNNQLKKELYNKEILFVAARENHVGIATFLLDHFVDIDLDADDGESTVLNMACESGHLGMVNWLLENGADINAQDRYFRTSIYYAVENGHFHVVELLVKKGANINATSDGYTILLHAAKFGDLGLVKWLAENGANIEAVSKYGFTVFPIAPKFQQLEIFQWLVEMTASVNANNQDGGSILHDTARFGNLNIVKWLVEKGANVNAVDYDHKSVLHSFAEFGKLDIIQYLLEKGADINATSHCGYTVLHSAAASGHLETVQWLVEKGAKIDAVDNEGWSVLHYALVSRRIDLVKWLIDNGANVNAVDNKGQIVLHIIVQIGNMELIKSVVKKGAIINVVNNEGCTVLHWVAAWGSLEIVKFLVGAGADLSNLNNDGFSALCIATEYGNLDIVKWLVDCGSDINVVDKEGHSLLYMAARFGKLEIVKWLLEYGVTANEFPTVLHVAAEFGRLNILIFLVENGADLRVTNDGHTVLYVAAKCRQLEIVTWLIENGAYSNRESYYCSSILSLAAKFGYLEIVQFMEEYSANINAVDKDGLTLLHHACRYGCLDIVKCLVDSGANIHAVGKYNCTVFHIAAKYGHLHIVKWLVEYEEIGDNVERVYSTVMHLAAKFGYLDIVKELIEKGAHVNAEDEHRCTPLHIAVRFGNKDIIKHLVENGADVNHVDNNNHSVLYIAVEIEDLDIVKFLVNNGAVVNPVLQYAARFAKPEIFEWLIEKK